MHRLLLLAGLLAVAACDSSGTGAAEIIRYDGPPITRAGAAVPNPPFSPAEWTANGFLGRADFNVYLRRTTLCGDECTRTVAFSFQKLHSSRTNSLPESVTGSVTVQSYLPESVETTEIPVARVEIQDWGPEVYSGVVYPVAGTGAPYVFWAESTGTAVE